MFRSCKKTNTTVQLPGKCIELEFGETSADLKDSGSAFRRSWLEWSLLAISGKRFAKALQKIDVSQLLTDHQWSNLHVFACSSPVSHLTTLLPGCGACQVSGLVCQSWGSMSGVRTLFLKIEISLLFLLWLWLWCFLYWFNSRYIATSLSWWGDLLIFVCKKEP